MTYSAAAIILYKGKYFFQKRSKRKNIFYPNYFGLFGGMSNSNEKPKDTIKRELYEETNLEFKLIKHFLTVDLSSSNFNPKRSSIFKRFYFVCELKKNFKKNIILREGQSYRFLNIIKSDRIKFVPFDFAVCHYHYLITSKKK